MPKTSPAPASVPHSGRHSVWSRLSAGRRRGNDAPASRRESGPRPPSSPSPMTLGKDPPRFRSIPPCRESPMADCRPVLRESPPPIVMSMQVKKKIRRTDLPCSPISFLLIFRIERRNEICRHSVSRSSSRRAPRRPIGGFCRGRRFDGNASMPPKLQVTGEFSRRGYGPAAPTTGTRRFFFWDGSPTKACKFMFWLPETYKRTS